MKCRDASGVASGDRITTASTGRRKRREPEREVDRAIAINPALEAFLSQQREERTSIADGYQLLEAIIEKAGVEVT